MKPFLISAFAASALLASPSVFADSHGSHDHHADQPAPTHEDCMALHDTMMVRHDAGEDHDTVMASLSDADREQMTTCHAMMEDMHAAHGEGDMTGHGAMHHDGEHGAHHGNHEMDADDETPSHDHE